MTVVDDYAVAACTLWAEEEGAHMSCTDEGECTYRCGCPHYAGALSHLVELQRRQDTWTS